MAWLKGKKTYLIVALLALIALIEFMATGDYTMAAFLAFGKSEAMIALGATIRAGIGSVKG